MEPDGLSARQQIPPFYDKNPPLHLIFDTTNPVHTLIHTSFKTHFNNILPICV
jgi:hypothetical protein